MGGVAPKLGSVSKRIRLAAPKGELEINRLFNDRTGYPFIRKGVAVRSAKFEPLLQPIPSKQHNKAQRLLTKRVALDFQIGGYRFSEGFQCLAIFRGTHDRRKNDASLAVGN